MFVHTELSVLGFMMTNDDMNLMIHGIGPNLIVLHRLYQLIPHGFDLTHIPFKYQQSILYGKTHSQPVTVGSKMCPQCCKIEWYDGLNDHIFNYNNRHLFTHDVLNGFLLEFKYNAKITMIGYVNKTNGAYIENGCVGKYSFVQNDFFAHVFIAFISISKYMMLLVCPACDRALQRDINAKPSGLVDSIVVDGVQTGFKKNYNSVIKGTKYIYMTSIG